MTSIINAASGGVTFTGGTTAELAIQAGGSTAAAFNSNGLFFRNRIINGDMRIDQRNAGASVTPSNGIYTLDRWFWRDVTTGKATIQRSTTAPTNFSNSTLITSTSAYTPASGDVFTFCQIIEGFNFADLAWGTASALTITISFWVRSSLTGTFSGVAAGVASSRSYPFTYTINAANTFEYKTITIPGDTSGTWATGNTGAFELRFSMGAGSTWNGTAGSWSSSTFYGATGSVNLVATNAATWYITGVQLETGSTATPFERRPYGTELALCQRYFLRVMSGGVDCAIICTRANGSSSSFTIYTPVSLRASPTIGVPSGTSPVTNNGRLVLYRTSDFALSQNEVTAMSLIVWSGQNQVDIGITNASATGDYVYATYDTAWATTALTLSSEL